MSANAAEEDLGSGSPIGGRTYTVKRYWIAANGPLLLLVLAIKGITSGSWLGALEPDIATSVTLVAWLGLLFYSGMSVLFMWELAEEFELIYNLSPWVFLFVGALPLFSIWLLLSLPLGGEQVEAIKSFLGMAIVAAILSPSLSGLMFLLSLRPSLGQPPDESG